LKEKPSIGRDTQIAGEPNQEVNDFLTLMLSNGQFDTYISLFLFSIALIVAVTMICCGLCYFSNYQMPRKTLA